MIYELTDCFDVPASLEETWEFFSRADNLQQITPTWLDFHIVTPQPIRMRAGTIIDYRITWNRLPMRWRTNITEWVSPRRFVDLQIRGPYVLWHHQHDFVRLKGGGTRCRDRVTYKPPFGPLGDMTHALIIRRQLLGIFRHRRDAIAQVLGPVTPRQPDVRIQRLSR